MSGSYEVHAPSQPPEGRWFTKLREAITVEPVLLLVAMAKALMVPTLAALIYRKVCLSHFSLQICTNLHNSSLREIEMLVQAESAYWLLAQNLSKGIPVFVLCFFYGSISDNVGRKAALVIPVAGHVLGSIGYLIQAIYVELPVTYLLTGWLVIGLSGGWSACNMAAFSYMSDVTTEKNRTFRIAVGEALIVLGMGISLLVGGMLLDLTSFKFVTSLSLGIYCILLIYIIVWVKEPPKSTPREPRSFGTICKVLCNFKSIREAVGCVFKRRKQSRRMHILIMCVNVLSTNMAIVAPLILIYLYVIKQPLSWSQTLFGVYVSYGVVMAVFGMVVIMPAMMKHQRMRETTVFLCTIISSAAGMTMLSFSVETWMAFIAPILGALGFCIQPIQRSLLSKLVENGEYGRIFAMFGAMQSLGHIFANLLYTNVYPRTLHIWPGLSFALAAAVLIIPFALVVFLRFDLKRLGWEGDEPQTDKNNNNTIVKTDIATKEVSENIKAEDECKTAMIGDSGYYEETP